MTGQWWRGKYECSLLFSFLSTSLRSDKQSLWGVVYWATFVPGHLPAAVSDRPTAVPLTVGNLGSCKRNYWRGQRYWTHSNWCSVKMKMTTKASTSNLQETFWINLWLRGSFSEHPDHLPHKVLTDAGSPQWEMALIRSIVCEQSSGLGFEMEGDNYLFIRLNSTAQWSG